MSASEHSVRIDKWLWAARFFKTRSLAKQAVEGGKVHYNGQRIKASKAVEIDAELRIRCGWEEKTVRICALAERRVSAAIAAQYYRETDDSLQARQQRQLQRQYAREARPAAAERPNKKQRRQIHRFKQQAGDSLHSMNPREKE